MGRTKSVCEAWDCPRRRSPRPAVLDSFSHFSHIKYTVGSYISRVVLQVPTTTTTTEVISSRNCEHFLRGGFVSIASTRIRCWGSSAARENRVYLMVWVQSGPQGFDGASAHSSENAYHKPWFSFFVRRTEHFHMPLRGVSHAEWPKDEHE